MTNAVTRSTPGERDSVSRNSRARVVLAKRRDDLDGLRAVAVILVVVYHVWVGRVSGGVDVFLMLSAFFMVASLVKRADRQALELGRYYVHRFWRLLPPAVVTIVLTLAIILFTFPRSFWPSAWSESLASLLYYENWELAASSADYYARDESSISAFQHFWSLSIQGQVFLLWPVLILIVAAVARRARINLRMSLGAVFGVIFAVSLTYSIVSTASNQAFAYFDTFARLWEFALGSLLGLIAVTIALPRWLAEPLAWMGLVGLVLCGVLIDVAGGFPGYLALWPTLCAALLILTGLNNERQTSAARLLSIRPLRAIGSIAYPLYLVHWPVLVSWIVLTGNSQPAPVEGVVIVMISVVLAITIHLVIEKPIGAVSVVERRPIWGVIAIASLLTTVIVPATAWQVAEQARWTQAAGDATNPGALVLDLGTQIDPDPATMIPAGALLTQEWAQLDKYCDGRDRPSGELAGLNCIEQDAPESADRMIIIGDSHAQQWVGAFAPLAAERGVKLTAMVLSACTFTTAPEAPSPFPHCDQWRSEVADYLASDPPEYVVLVGTQAVTASNENRLREGLGSTIDDLADLGITVVLMRDNPRLEHDMFRCVEDNLDDVSACDVPRQTLINEEDPLQAYEAIDHIYAVDMSDSFCPGAICPAVIGNVALYIDSHHITWAYMKTLSPRLGRALDDAGFPW